MGQSSSQPPARFDVKAAHLTIGEAISSVLRLSLRGPAAAHDEELASSTFKAITLALMAGSSACAEVTRLHAELSAQRDRHRPRPHADPRAPGALCDACSLHGALVSWPCAVWQAAESILGRAA